MRNPLSETKDITKLARRAVLYRGVQKRVIQRLGLSKGHVSLVTRGLRRSPIVEQALAEEVRRLEKRNGR